MRRTANLSTTGLVVLLLMVGCASSGAGKSVKDDGPAGMMVSEQEARAHGGWMVTPDDGPVDGDTTDCTGAPYDWPHVKTVAHASQFLNAINGNDYIAVVVKELNGSAAANIKAVRGAIAPCVPASAVKLHGAMIQPVGDDSFAYQTEGKDDTGKYVQDDTLVACGKFEMEALWISYSQTLDQAGLESLLASAIKRMLKVGHCSSE